MALQTVVQRKAEYETEFPLEDSTRCAEDTESSARTWSFGTAINVISAESRTKRSLFVDRRHENSFLVLGNEAGPTMKTTRESQPLLKRFLRRAARWLAIATVIMIWIVAIGYAYWRYEFPYGPSHCCDLPLHFSLREYAEAHGGNFPAGAATPEASLSLLYGTTAHVTADLLRGKSVPESVVREILARGERLTPETCGWHYVENLRLDDDPRLALFWDKAGLGHNGERLSGGGHLVMFIDGRRRHIPSSEWPEFMAEQEKLLAKAANAPRDTR
jgi:hypothetical protein